MTDRLLLIGWGLLALAAVTFLGGISLAIAAQFNGTRSLTAALLALWSILPWVVGMGLVFWRTT